MNEPSDTGAPVVFRAVMSLCIFLGALVGVPMVLGLVVMIQNPANWQVFAVGCGLEASILAALRYLRFEIGHGGIHYRNWTANRSLKYSDMKRAGLEVIVGRYYPQGIAVFVIEPKEGRSLRIRLDNFPILASALLFTELERRNIPIHVPERWAAKRMAGQIRAAQAKLLSRTQGAESGEIKEERRTY